MTITIIEGKQSIGQEDIPTIKHPEEPHPRVSKANEHPLGARRPEKQKAEGEKTPDRVAVERYTFSRSERLRIASDFDRVYTSGTRIVSSRLMLIFAPSPVGVTRMGLSVSRKIGKAVVRNRVKRLLREAFRLNKHQVRKGYDILLVARKGVEDLKFRQVELVLMDLSRKGGLLERGTKDSGAVGSEPGAV
jgi:ribonuclease P protein component